MRSCTFLLLCYFALLLGCGGPAHGDVGVEAIRGGRTDGAHDAVGLLGVAASRSSSSVSWRCTGTLIEPDLVLTAAHCLMGSNGRRVATSRLRFLVGEEVFAVRRSRIAEDYYPLADVEQDDLAVLELAAESWVEPIAVARSIPFEGERAVVVGFGVTSATGPGSGSGGGTRRRANIFLDAVADRELAYDAEERGACYGDSGGPLLQDLGEGEVVVGVTSRGTSVTCDGINIATRVDVFVPWIEEGS